MKKYTKKLTAIVCSLSLCLCSAVQAMPARSLDISSGYTDDTIQQTVKVIITLNESSVYEKAGKDLSESIEDPDIPVSVEASQKTVQEYIRKLYPDFRPGFNYSLLLNGFSCDIPQEIIPSVFAHPLVKSVSEVRKTQRLSVTDNYDYGNSGWFSDYTGCRGEGKVIAVIDTELDISHEMFSPIDDKNNKITKQDVEKIRNSGMGFNGYVDTDKAYVSSKLPFVFNYSGGEISNPEIYHGTHVAGIAAGNKTALPDGTWISGAAPDAQIIFMGSSDENEQICEDAVIAAIEDAVKLGADVINMSFSDDFEVFRYNDPFETAVTAAEEAGVIICKSAGNSSRFIKPVDEPNYGTICAQSGYPGVMSVASVQSDNGYFEADLYIMFNGAKIGFTPVVGYDPEDDCNYSKNFAGSLFEKEYEITAPDTDDIENADISGKIVFFNPDDEETYRTIRNSYEKLSDKGAAAVIYSLPDSIETDEIYSVPLEIPGAVISKQSADYIAGNIDAKTVTICDMDEDYDGKMNIFSSWGVSSSLKLEPDITGYGTDILSADYGNTYTEQSGTSMSAPFVAGCAAAAEELAEKRGYRAEGKEKSLFIRNLLMNSAVPVTDKNGLPISPRKQGAGVVNMQRLSDCSVLITGDSGEGKIELFDGLTDNFSFDVTISNFGENNVEFEKAELILFTDNACYYPDYSCYYSFGSVPLHSESDLSSLLKIESGETRTEKITVDLDSSQTEEITQLFTNGFFVDGYILLSGSGSCSDVSVPLLGFCGDWDRDKLMDRYTYNTVTDPLSLLISGINEDYRQGLDYHYYLYEKASENGTLFINPENKGFRDKPFGQAEFLRDCFRTGELTDNNDGSLVNEISLFTTSLADAYMVIPEGLKDGSYTGRIKAFTDFYRSKENPETIEFSFTSDTVPPESFFDVYEKNGRKILHVKAEDDNLDGLIIMGVKNDNPANPDPAEVLQTIGSYLNVSDQNFDGWKHSDIERMMSIFNQSPVSCHYNFIDSVYAGGNTSMDIEYDITDLEQCYAVLSDRAYNFTEFRPSGSEKKYSMRPGTWMTNDNRILFVDSTGKAGVSYSPVADTSFSFKMENEGSVIRLYDDLISGTFESSRYGYAEIVNSEYAFLDFEFSENSSEAYFMSDEGQDDFRYYDYDKIKRLISAFAETEFGCTLQSLDPVSTDLEMEFKGKIGSDNDDLLQGILDIKVNIIRGFAEFSYNGHYIGKFPLYQYDPDIICGDADGNGTVNAADIAYLKQSVLMPYRQLDISRTDIDYDMSVTIIDVVKLVNLMMNS